MKIFWSLILIFIILPSISSQNSLELINQELTQQELLGHLEFLASDALQGRNTGSQGLEAAAAYLASQFRSVGIQEVEGSYFQGVPFTTFSPPSFASATIGEIDLAFPNDFIAINGMKTKVTSETVDIGYGSAEEIAAVDLKLKIAVSKAGDGNITDPREWIAVSREKRKRVQEAGGSALVEIYQSTTVPWRFLRMLGTQAQTTFDEGVDNSDFTNIWVGTSDSLTIALLQKGKQTMTLELDEVKREKFTSDNVIGFLPGTDPNLKDEFIVYSAHYDHVGIGNADASGDNIYNGARDNAVGTTAVLSLAKYFAKNPPKRSSYFVFFTAEEKGLLGSRYFTQHLPVSAEKIKYNFNIDNGGYNDTTIVSVIGLTRTEAEQDIQSACQALGLTAIEDPAKEQGLFDRSDNVNFAVLGIPAPTFSLGFRSFDQEIFKYYHQPGDHVESLNMDYIEKYVKAYILSSIKIANGQNAPFWNEGDKYYEAGVKLYDRK